MGRWILVVVVALVTPARAQPPRSPIVRLEVQGTCPRTDDLRRAFDGRVPLSDDGGGWTVAVSRGERSSRLDVRRADGSDAFDREIAARIALRSPMRSR